MTKPKRIRTDEDLSSLVLGDIVSFNVLSSPQCIPMRAVYIGTYDRYNFYFIGRHKKHPEKIYEFWIDSEKLQPTRSGILKIASRTTVCYEEITIEDNPAFYNHRDEELKNVGL